MNRRKFILALLVCGAISSQAQVRFLEDPNTSINMDIEAKSQSAFLEIETFSRTNQIQQDPYVVITLMNDSVMKLTGIGRNTNKMIDTDEGHGFADRFHSKARFMISPQQAESFKNGIKNIMIRMVTNAFYYEWTKDELGLPLYSRYVTSKENVMFKKKNKKKESR